MSNKEHRNGKIFSQNLSTREQLDLMIASAQRFANAASEYALLCDLASLTGSRPIFMKTYYDKMLHEYSALRLCASEMNIHSSPVDIQHMKMNFLKHVENGDNLNTESLEE